MNWHKPLIDRDTVHELAQDCKIDLLTATILVRRHYNTDDDLPFFLEQELDGLHNPFLFDEMEQAVERLRRARNEDERVLVFGDRDTDGVSATALMFETLRDEGISQIAWRVPMGDDAYGLTSAIVDEYAAMDYTLIVTVDCGISNIAEIAHARELGIDVIVVDHHNPRADLPPATAIIDAKLADSSYPFDGLCGCAVAFKLRWALFYARGDWYNRDICLLNIRLGNENTCIFELRKLRNGIEIDRLNPPEVLAPKIMRFEQTRLAAFTNGLQIVVYDAVPQKHFFSQIFGQSVELNCIDIAAQIATLFPAIENKSLLKIATAERRPRYKTTDPSEIETLVSLFNKMTFYGQPQLVDSIRSALDIVTLATIGDVMPLRNENRLLVRHGMARITEKPRPGILALMNKGHNDLIGRPLTTRDIGFQITPIINSAGRLGEPDKAVHLLLANDAASAEKWADQTIALNKRRRTIGGKAWDRLLPEARISLEQSDHRLILVRHVGLHRGVTGLLAGRLARAFDVPAIVIATLETWSIGSIRSVRGFKATEFLQQFADILLEWGGHDEAAGFQIDAEHIDEFERRVRQGISTIQLEKQDTTILLDAEFPNGTYLTPELYTILERFEPFGPHNRPLIFKVCGAHLQQIEIIGKQDSHLRLLFDMGTLKWPAIFWNAADRVGNDFHLGDRVDLLFELERNWYNGTETKRIKIIDIKQANSDKRMEPTA